MLDNFDHKKGASSSSSNRFGSSHINRQPNHHHQSPKNNQRKLLVTDSGGGGSDMAPKLPPKPVREQARVLYSYQAQNDDELTIKEGDIILIISKENEDVGWWKGELNGRIALFPDNFVEIIKPLPPPSAPGPPAPTAGNEKGARVKKPDRLLSSSTSSSSSAPPPPPSSSSPQSSTSCNNNNAAATSNGIITVATASNTSSSSNNSLPVSATTADPITVGATSVATGITPSPNAAVTGSTTSKDMDGAIGTSINNDGTGDAGTTASANSKLVHLTAQRPKIPTNSRRPPSVHFTAAAAEALMSNGGVGGGENGFDPAPESPSETEMEKPATSPPEKVAPWVAELRMAQEKKREQREQQQDGKSTATTAAPPVIPGVKPFVPKGSKPITAISSNSNSQLSHQHSLDSSSSNQSSETVTSHPLFHHTRNSSLKSIASLTNTGSTTTTTSITSQQPIISNSNKNLTNDMAPASPKLPATNSVTIEEAEYAKLKTDLNEIRQRLTETERQMQQFIKQQSTQMDKMQATIKELVESDRKSKATVKEVINEWAEERKKLAVIQIELDRLRKLNTTV